MLLFGLRDVLGKISHEIDLNNYKKMCGFIFEEWSSNKCWLMTSFTIRAFPGAPSTLR